MFSQSEKIENFEINLSDNAKKILEARYLKKDDQNKTETPKEMFYRVASFVSKAELEFGASENEAQTLAQDFFEIMAKKDFMPNSPTLMNAGKVGAQLSACFVLPIEDSLEAIFETLKNTALIHQSGGGTGFSFSRLRPKGDKVKSTGGTSSGPISFMEVYNAATEAVKQGGARRGANMGILRVDHPDILDFIHAKDDLSKLNNFNISVAITDAFMEALLNNENYNLIHPTSREVVKTLKAKDVFDQIVKSAWQTGEPGVIFIDRINKNNPTPLVGEIESTNPCGEVPLLPYEACNLGSINLSNMIRKNAADGKDVDWTRLSKTVKLAVNFLDNVICVNSFPLEKIKETVQKNRKIGLGVMGFADMLMKLNIPYSSPEARVLAGKIMEFIDYHAKAKSVSLSEVRGRFENFEKSVYNNPNYLYERFKGKSKGAIIDEMWKDLDKRIAKFGIRNATLTCIAPTGTISIIAGTTGGIEPAFGLVFKRNILDNSHLLEINPVFENYAKENGFYSENLMEEIAQVGSLKHISTIDNKTKEIFETAHDIMPEAHILMQAAFGEHVDNAVSKTINFEESATVEDIAKAYILGYKSKLKGLTVYRNNSRWQQPMAFEGKKNEPEDKAEPDFEANIKTVVCPECGNTVEMAEGCFICLNCGYSGCV